MKRLPPHDLNAEKGLLGAILIRGELADSVATLLDGSEFYSTHHGAVWHAIMALWAESKPIDAVTVNSALSGDLDLIVELTTSNFVTSNVNAYATRIKNCYERRQQISIAKSIAEAAHDNGDVKAHVSELDETLSGTRDRAPKSAAQVAHSILDLWEDPPEPTETGFVDLDTKIGGYAPQSVNLIAARPGHGKSMFATTCAIKWLADGKRVMLFSLEMPAAQVGARIINGKHLVGDMRHPNRWSEAQQGRAIAGADWLQRQAIVIDDQPSISVAELIAKARVENRRNGLDIIIVDYVQLITAPGSASRREEVGAVSRALKELAMSLDVIVIGLCQLNRMSESRVDPMPQLSDLRESGDLEQDADSVIAFHQPGIKDPTDPDFGSALCTVLKNRHGSQGGQFKLAARGQYSRFDSLSSTYISDSEPLRYGSDF